jgi:hypothetical protein
LQGESTAGIYQWVPARDYLHARDREREEKNDKKGAWAVMHPGFAALCEGFVRLCRTRFFIFLLHIVIRIQIGKKLRRIFVKLCRSVCNGGITFFSFFNIIISAIRVSF